MELEGCKDFVRMRVACCAILAHSRDIYYQQQSVSKPVSLFRARERPRRRETPNKARHMSRRCLGREFDVQTCRPMLISHVSHDLKTSLNLCISQQLGSHLVSYLRLRKVKNRF
jgi:hypothetical protein